MKHFTLFLIFIMFNLNTFGQDSDSTGKGVEIQDIITVINKNSLFDGWREVVGDTLNPTSLTIDLNSDDLPYPN